MDYVEFSSAKEAVDHYLLTHPEGELDVTLNLSNKTDRVHIYLKRDESGTLTSTTNRAQPKWYKGLEQVVRFANSRLKTGWFSKSKSISLTVTDNAPARAPAVAAVAVEAIGAPSVAGAGILFEAHHIPSDYQPTPLDIVKAQQVIVQLESAADPEDLLFDLSITLSGEKPTYFKLIENTYNQDGIDAVLALRESTFALFHGYFPRSYQDKVAAHAIFYRALSSGNPIPEIVAPYQKSRTRSDCLELLTLAYYEGGNEKVLQELREHFTITPDEYTPPTYKVKLAARRTILEARRAGGDFVAHLNDAASATPQLKEAMEVFMCAYIANKEAGVDALLGGPFAFGPLDYSPTHQEKLDAFEVVRLSREHPGGLLRWEEEFRTRNPDKPTHLLFRLVCAYLEGEDALLQETLRTVFKFNPEEYGLRSDSGVGLPESSPEDKERPLDPAAIKLVGAVLSCSPPDRAGVFDRLKDESPVGAAVLYKTLLEEGPTAARDYYADLQRREPLARSDADRALHLVRLAADDLPAEFLTPSPVGLIQAFSEADRAAIGKFLAATTGQDNYKEHWLVLLNECPQAAVIARQLIGEGGRAAMEAWFRAHGPSEEDRRASAAGIGIEHVKAIIDVLPIVDRLTDLGVKGRAALSRFLEAASGKATIRLEWAILLGQSREAAALVRQLIREHGLESLQVEAGELGMTEGEKRLAAVGLHVEHLEVAGLEKLPAVAIDDSPYTPLERAAVSNFLDATSRLDSFTDEWVRLLELHPRVAISIRDSIDSYGMGGMRERFDPLRRTSEESTLHNLEIATEDLEPELLASLSSKLEVMTAFYDQATRAAMRAFIETARSEDDVRAAWLELADIENKAAAARVRNNIAKYGLDQALEDLDKHCRELDPILVSIGPVPTTSPNPIRDSDIVELRKLMMIADRDGARFEEAVSKLSDRAKIQLMDGYRQLGGAYLGDQVELGPFATAAEQMLIKELKTFVGDRENVSRITFYTAGFDAHSALRQLLTTGHTAADMYGGFVALFNEMQPSDQDAFETMANQIAQEIAPECGESFFTTYFDSPEAQPEMMVAIAQLAMMRFLKAQRYNTEASRLGGLKEALLEKVFAIHERIGEEHSDAANQLLGNVAGREDLPLLNAVVLKEETKEDAYRLGGRLRNLLERINRIFEGALPEQVRDAAVRAKLAKELLLPLLRIKIGTDGQEQFDAIRANVKRVLGDEMPDQDEDESLKGFAERLHTLVYDKCNMPREVSKIVPLHKPEGRG